MSRRDACPTPASLTGTLELHVTPEASLPDASATALRTAIEAFLRAVEIGLFGPVELGTRSGLASGTDGSLTLRVEVQDLPVGALRVLGGMLACVTTKVSAPMRAAARVLADPRADDLLGVTATWPAGPAALPFSFGVHVPATVAPPLAVSIDFAAPLDAAFVDRLESDLRVWEALVCGGYPPADGPPGASFIAPLQVRLDSPSTLRAATEGVHADDACFDALAHLLMRVHAVHRIVAVEIA